MTNLERDTQFIMEATNVTREDAEKIARALWVRHKDTLPKQTQTRAKRTKGFFSHIEDNIIIDAFWYKVKVGAVASGVILLLTVLLKMLVMGGIL